MHCDPGWIEDLLEGNQAPSDEAAREVKELLVIPMKDLEDLDAEIFQLKSRLSELERKRIEIQKRISRYKPILAPIRRVPPDVLPEIFYQCLPTDRNPAMKSDDCPLLLTRICSLWRAVAMSTPKVWERIHITFTDDDMVPDIESAAEMVRNGHNLYPIWQSAQSKAKKEATTKLLRRRYEAVRDWLLRSGTRPLLLTVCFTTTQLRDTSFSDFSETYQGISMELFSFLATLSPRWKEFEFKGSVEAYTILESVLVASQMTMLTSLICHYYYQFAESLDGAIPLGALGAPNLREISMSGGENDIWDITERTSIHWTKLTTITCLFPLSPTATIFVLEHASNLVHYAAMISAYAAQVVTVTAEGPIYLPFLETSSLNDTVNFYHDLYDRIDAPKLREVNYCTHSFPHVFSAGNIQNRPNFPLLPLLCKSTELRNLTIDGHNLMNWNLGSLLRAVPSITDLVIGAKERSSVGTSSQPPSGSSSVFSMVYNSNGYLYNDNWTFSDLIVQNISSADLEDNGTLLPELRSLVIANPSVRVDDGIIFDLIKSRMVSNTTKTLECARVVFFKERERDFLGELTQYAKDIGLKISLDFEYVQSTPPDQNPISPEYGLMPRPPQPGH